MVPWVDWASMGQLGSSSTALQHQQELQPSRGHLARVSKSGALVGTDGSQGSAGVAEMGWDFSSFLIVSWHLLFHVVSPHGLYCWMAVIIIDTYQLSSQECRSRFQALISLRLRIGIFYAISYLSLWVPGPVQIHCGRRDYIRASVLGGMAHWWMFLETNYYIYIDQ